MRRIDQFTPPVVYNWSLGVQRDIGFNLVADAAYVGNAARNSSQPSTINGRPYGYAYQPSSLDPTNVVGRPGAAAARRLLRPYRGFGRIQQREFDGYARLSLAAVLGEPPAIADGLSFGAAYTYQIVEQEPRRHRSVRRGQPRQELHVDGRRPHILVFNYSYEVPNLSQKWNNLLVKAIFDNWQVSGVTTILSGTYGGFTYSYANVPTGA